MKSLIDRAKAVGCSALALTDHNGLYGAIRFYKYAQKAGIKPIIGTEMEMKDGGHIVLLSKNLSGYSNLCKIVTRAQLSHEKGQAKASIDTLNQYRENIFCLSGCQKGRVPSLVAAGRVDDARKIAEKFVDIFGRKNFLIELQNHLLPGTNLLNTRLSELANDLSLRVVATNNVHYAQKEDFKVQDVLTCVHTR